MFYDGLPVWLRGFDLSKPSRFMIQMLPTMLSNDSTMTKSIPAEIEILGPTEPFSVNYYASLQVDVRYDGKVDHLRFHPHMRQILQVWEKADGSKLQLIQTR